MLIFCAQGRFSCFVPTEISKKFTYFPRKRDRMSAGRRGGPRPRHKRRRTDMTLLLTAMQLMLTLVVGLYFFRQLRRDREARPTRREGRRRDGTRAPSSLHPPFPAAQRGRAPEELCRDRRTGGGCARAAGRAMRQGPATRPHLRPTGRGQDLRGTAGAGGGQALGGHALPRRRALCRDGRHLPAL